MPAGTKTAPKVTRSKVNKGGAGRVSRGGTPARAGRPATGPSKATLDFAAKVVKLRDKDGLAWAEVAAKLGVPYDHNGSSRLRRAYNQGGGATVGVRAKAAKKTATKAKPAAKRTATPKGTSRKRGATK